MLGHQDREPFARGPWIDRSGAKRRTEQVVRDFRVATPGVGAPAYALSGGNQQKLVFAAWLCYLWPGLRGLEFAGHGRPPALWKPRAQVQGEHQAVTLLVALAD